MGKDWFERNTGFCLPILMIFIFAFGGMAWFGMMVFLYVYESIPHDFSAPWYANVFAVIPVVIGMVMLLWVKKYDGVKE